MANTPLATRKAINWRIPIDLLDRVDQYRKTTKQDRTAVVVDALASFLYRHEHVLVAAAPKRKSKRRKSKRRPTSTTPTPSLKYVDRPHLVDADPGVLVDEQGYDEDGEG
jgi:hypothetical protein